jgi:ABC-type phosphate transport system substrate-binding protein
MRAIPPLLVALLAVFVLALLAPAPAVSAPAEVPAYVVIVNPGNRNQSLARKFVADAFLKKTSRWPNGETIRPVDLSSESGARERFSQDVLKRSVAAVRSYWQQSIFAGRDVPPPELASDEEIVRYVLKHGGAIGYVSGGANLGETKVVKIQ